MMKYSSVRLKAYLEHGHGDVAGWTDKFDMDLIVALAKIQSDNNVRGAVGEVGVGVGRLLILLDLLRNDGEEAFCIDVFDKQELNVDNSWYSAEATFCANVLRHVGDIDGVRFLRGSSDGFAPKDITSLVGHVRLFSVDGGHTKHITINDISLADKTIGNLGVVILDDVFHYQWPGVADGLFSYFLRKDINIKPFAISRTKVYLCKPDNADVIRSEFRKENGDQFLKECEFLGSSVDIYSPPAQPISALDRFARSEHWHRVRTTPLGRLLRSGNHFLRRLI